MAKKIKIKRLWLSGRWSWTTLKSGAPRQPVPLPRPDPRPPQANSRAESWVCHTRVYAGFGTQGAELRFPSLEAAVDSSVGVMVCFKPTPRFHRCVMWPLLLVHFPDVPASHF